MTHPEGEVGGSDAPVIAAEPTIEDRFAAIAEQPEDEPKPEEAAEPATSQDDGEAEQPELTAEDVDDDPDAEAELPPIKPPVSWTTEEQAAFAELPRELQETLGRREAEREKFVQSKAQEAKQARSQVESEALAAVQQLQTTYAAQLEVLMPQIPQRPSHQLQADDPWAYAEQMDAYERTVAQAQQIQQQLAAIQHRAAANEQVAKQQAFQREQEALKEQLPEWFDATEGPKLHQQMKSIATELGYSAEQLNDATATEVLALKKVSELKAKADKYDTLMAKKMEQVRSAKGLPRVSKPGVAQGKGAVANQRYTADRQAMKSGDQDAAARVFSRFL